MLIRKAERKKAKLRLGISGPSGGGKTWSALEIAHGMGGKIGMIDTESGRGELYAGERSVHEKDITFQYDVIRLDAPFSPERYIEAIQTFEKAGYDVLIIDSLSHAWSGEGGVLSIVDKAGGQFQNGWKVGTPKQNALVDALINSKMHVIANLRAKTEYVVEKDDRGKNVPRKIGLAPIQRDQLEYEFTVFMNMSHDNVAHVTKDNSKLYNQEFVKPSPSMGRKLIEWMNTGIDEKENFKNVILPHLLCEIDELETMQEFNDYREKYIAHYRAYADQFADDFAQVTAAKDNRKIKLMEAEMNSMSAPQVPIATATSKYSQTLINQTQGAA